MHAEQQQPAGISYVAIERDPSARWRRRESFACVSRLMQLPISDSELLVCSHHLPIAIELGADEPQVVAITAAPFQRTPLLDKDSQWRRGYAPIALRCLPFRLSPSRAHTLEIAVDLEGANAAELPVLGKDGQLVPEIKQTIGLLRRLDAGRQRLGRAAEKLLIADVLAPFQMMRAPGGASVRSPLLTVDRNKYATLSAKRVSHIARDDFLAIDLAAACLFSQRLVPGPISVAVETKPTAAEATEQPSALLEFKTTTQLDDSELFSFDAFVKAGHRDD